MSEHFIERFECGHVANQCRCPGPKTERAVPGKCAACADTPAPSLGERIEGYRRNLSRIAEGRYPPRAIDAHAEIAAAKREGVREAVRWCAENRRLDHYLNPEYTMRNPETVEAYIERALTALTEKEKP